MKDEQRAHLDVIAAYGKALESNPAPLRDVSELPHPKEEIKAALRFALENFGKLFSDENLRGMLREGYLTLADFQDFKGNVPTPVSEVASTDIEDLMENPESLLGGTEEYQAGLVLADQERVKLEQELGQIESNA